MKNTKLYNVIFPVWMLLLVPSVWLIVLPGNFLIDSAVLLICMYALKLEEKKTFYWKNIFKIFGFGLLADVIGAAFLFLTVIVLEWSRMGDDLYLTIPAMLISAVFIFLFNYNVTFKHYPQNIRFKVSLTFAIATAPYTFLIPTTWLY